MYRWFCVMAICLFPSWLWAGDLQVEQAWVRLPPPVADSAAVYARIANHGADTVRIEGVRASGTARMAMIHEMEMRNGRMHMRAVDVLRIEPGGVVRLQPGGMHIMLMHLDHPLQTGDVVEIELSLGDGSVRRFSAEVRDTRSKVDSLHQR